MPISSVPDHVAAAVPAIEAAARRWHGELGGRWVGPRFASDEAGFAARQVRYRGGAKLELVEPVTPDAFAARFLTRYGARIHHVTLEVPALLPAVAQVRAAGLDVIDVFADGEVWHEGFLRPSQVGGLIVQLAWSGRTDAEWAAAAGFAQQAPAADAARLLGPTLSHPDPMAAAEVWRVLGAEVVGDADGLRVAWPDAALDIEILPGPEASPVGLRFADVTPHPGDAEVGPATLVPARHG